MMKRWGNIGVITIAVMTLFCASKQEVTDASATQKTDTTVTEQEPLVDEHGFTNLLAKAPLPDTISLEGGGCILYPLGWSDNSKYFAFGERGDGDRTVLPHLFAEFWLIDVEKDNYVKGISASIKKGGEDTLNPDVAPILMDSEVESVEGNFLKKSKPYGIPGTKLGTKLEMVVHERTDTHERIELKSKDGKTYELIMNKDFRATEECHINGRFELKITDKTTGKNVWLQKAGKYFQYRNGYSIHSAYIDPTNTYIAVFTVKTRWGFEGSAEPRFMVNTGRLP
jgi:predicted secreted protein